MPRPAPCVCTVCKGCLQRAAVRRYYKKNRQAINEYRRNLWTLQYPDRKADINEYRRKRRVMANAAVASDKYSDAELDRIAAKWLKSEAAKIQNTPPEGNPLRLQNNP
jgi:hypothetical protein